MQFGLSVFGPRVIIGLRPLEKKTKSKPSAAGSIWKGAATEWMSGDFCKKVAANDMPSAATWSE